MKSNETLVASIRNLAVVIGLGACLSTSAFAQKPGPGSAVNFMGTNGYARVPNGVWFSNNFTVEGWVYVRNYNNWSRLIDFANGPNTNNVFLALSGGTGGFPVMGVYTNNNGQPNFTATNQLPLNQWTHLAATLNGTTGTIYINGSVVGSGTLNVPPNIIRTNCYIGRSNYGGDADANAIFDEIRIWNVARSRGQIQADLHRSLSGTESNLLAYWRMDEASGTTLDDATGHGQTATVFGGTSWTNSAAQIVSGAGGAVNFASSQSGTVAHQPALNAYPLTVMTWFKTTTGGLPLINKYVSSSLNGYNFFVGTGGLLHGWYFRDGANSVFDMIGGPVMDGKWHHAAMVIDAAGGRIYVDGVQTTSLPWTGTPGSANTTQPLSFNLYPGDFLGNGQIDESSVWNASLSAAQIQQYMTNTLVGTETGLLCYWRMDEGTGTNVVDSTGHGYNATLNGNPTWAASGAPLTVRDPGYAVNLSGGGEYIKVTTNVWFSGDFTIEGWVYARNYNNWSRLLEFANGQPQDNVLLALSQGTSGLPVFQVFNGTGGTSVGSPIPLPLNQWAHLAATLSGSTGTLYINGVAVNSGGMTLPNAVVRTNNYIGKSAFGGDAPADALFDEVRIWNVARSQLQIQQNMNRPLTGAESGLTGYWRCDDAIGTNVVDATGKGNHASLVNGPTWKISSAPATGAPVLSPLPAIDITAASATLQAMVKPNGWPTSVYFSYGTNQVYGFTNVVPNVGSGFDPLLVTNNISGLVQGAVYHFQVSASNSFGLTIGADQTFFATDPPGVTTLAATTISSTNAMLNGTLTPYGADAFAWFQYGLTTNYDSVTPSILVPGTNLAAVSISNVIGSLYPGIPYHFRLVGSNVSGITFGLNLTFTPPPAAPGIISQTASGITLTNALLNAVVTVNGADTTAWFQYGLTANYGSSTVATNINGTNLAAIPISSLISNLSAGTVYHFQLVATNAAGTSYGGDQLFTTLAFAQSITALSAAFLGSLAWGDFNNDGLLDVLISGATHPSGNNPITRVWRNNGNGFSFYASLPGVSRSSVAWGDYDNDGLLDILIAGYDAGFSPITQVWRNTGSGFDFVNTGLPGIANCSVAWGDYDNDGRRDILIAGSSPGGPIAQVWRNTGSGFTNINAGLPGVDGGSVAWGDYDNDGRLDILVAGSDPNSGAICQVWRNTGNGFTNINVGLPGVNAGSVAWGDYDNDGRLDILLLGGSFSGVTEIWRNTSNGFTNINAGLPGLSQGCAAWGDFNGDGRLDIVISGVDAGYVPHAQVWLNSSSGFVKSPDLPGLYYTSASFGDYNNDGRLDLLISGLPQNAINFTTQLWRNQTTPTNSLPAAPSGLSAALSRSSLALSWNDSSDLQTATPGLTYNLRVGTTPGGSDILGPMADANGKRRLPQRGTIQSTRMSLEVPASLVPGTFLYWSVQGIDTSFAGSSFAPETSVLIRPFFSSSGRRSDGAFQAQFDVQAGTNYTIEASTDLVHWLNLLDFSFGSSGPVLFTDPGATNYPQRFYRFGQH